MISLIVAMTKNGVIGDGNRRPWHLPPDLKRFRDLTLNKPCIFGRRTYDALPLPADGSEPLKDRDVWVMTRNHEWEPKHSGGFVWPFRREAFWEQLVTLDAGHPEVMVCGGAFVYREALALTRHKGGIDWEKAPPLVQRIYLTEIHDNVPGSVFFPPWDRSAWRVVQEEYWQPRDGAGSNAMPHVFSVLERKNQEVK